MKYGKKLFGYSQYQDFQLLESLIQERSLVGSARFTETLKKIDTPVAQKVLLGILDQEDIDGLKYSFLDYNPQSNQVSFLPLDKENEVTDFYQDKRVPVKLGKLFRYLYYQLSGAYPDNQDLEATVNKFKSLINDESQLQIVSGYDINKYYLEDNYENSKNKSSLAQSCMKEPENQKFIRFYNKYSPATITELGVNNSIEMLILPSSPGKISGRALVWNLDISGTLVTVMDRIYTNYDGDIELFKKYARNQGWAYKEKQNHTNQGNIKNLPSGIEVSDLVFNLVEGGEELLPYLDTFRYYTLNAKKGKYQLRCIPFKEGTLMFSGKVTSDKLKKGDWFFYSLINITGSGSILQPIFFSGEQIFIP